MRVQAVFFDAGGTLFTERASRPSIYCGAFAARGLAVPEAAMAAAMARAHATLPRAVGGHYRYSDRWFEAFIREVAAAIGFAGDLRAVAADLFAAFSDPHTFRVFDDVRPMAAALRAMAGDALALGVISNWSPRLASLLDRLGLKFFAPVVASASVDLEKPDPEIFRRAAALAGIAPEAAVHVGDRRDNDWQGARAAGMRSLLLVRDRRLQGDDVIASLAEVPERLRREIAP